MQEKITLDTMIEKITGLDITDLDGEKIMMDMEQGHYFMLNPVGSCIWDKLEEPKVVQTIIKELLEEYDVDEATCTQEVIKFCEQLSEMKLIKVRDNKN